MSNTLHIIMNTEYIGTYVVYGMVYGV